MNEDRTSEELTRTVLFSMVRDLADGYERRWSLYDVLMLGIAVNQVALWWVLG